MFTRHPDYHAMFTKFARIPIERLPDNAVFVDHATIVAKALDDALSVLDDLDKAKTILRRIGKKHANKNMNELHLAVSALIAYLYGKIKLLPPALLLPTMTKRFPTSAFVLALQRRHRGRVTKHTEGKIYRKN